MSDNYTDVELAVSNLYIAFHKLRKAGNYQEEYDSMGSLLSMLSEDRDYIRKTYNLERI